ncbi:M48 family metalloprotease [Chitinimonas lacunae]|uniref:M48 family metalloprotease n=1 Tax=Chitinimonas lacunae TaxID=1963018 RepID=A0ABV8MP05_9NEIS
MTRTLSLLALALLLVQSPGAVELPDLGDSSQAGLPPHEERKIAEMTARELRRSGEVIDDIEVTDFLSRLGYKLVSHSQDSRVPFRFYPLLSPEINAWAVPGGVIGINSGLVLLTQHESELAAVLSHEIAHVTQHHYARLLESQKGNSFMTLGALAVAILASRSNSEALPASLIASQNAMIQRYLDFSRDFEREADRVGIDTLQRAGYDSRAMPTFFDRMQRHYRNVDNGAFAFLRTHPVTAERLSDSQARAEKQPYRLLPDSPDYLFTREKLRGLQMGGPAALNYYSGTTAERKYADAAAQSYGYAHALFLIGRYDEAWNRLAEARRRHGRDHPMLAGLAARIRLEQGRFADARTLLGESRNRFPSAPGLLHGEIDLLLRQGETAEAVALIERTQQERRGDALLYKRLAEAHTQRSQPLQAHKAMAEYYAAIDETGAAIEQLRIALRSSSDFYQTAALEARIKELRAQQDPEQRKKTQAGQ